MLFIGICNKTACVMYDGDFEFYNFDNVDDFINHVKNQDLQYKILSVDKINGIQKTTIFHLYKFLTGRIINRNLLLKEVYKKYGIEFSNDIDATAYLCSKKLEYDYNKEKQSCI